MKLGTKNDAPDRSSELVPSYAKELGTRISVIAEAIGDRKTAASVAGISSDSLQRYIRGEVQAPFAALVKLCLASGYSLEWLATGNDQASKMESDISPANDDQPAPASLASPSPDDYCYVPLYDVYASAGHGAVIEQEPIKSLLAFKQSWLRGEMGLSPENCCLIYVKGDSMEPTLHKNDVVMLDRANTIYIDDGMYCLRFDGGLVIKRVQRINATQIKVISDNTIYEPYIIGITDAEIVGKVVWIGKRV